MQHFSLELHLHSGKNDVDELIRKCRKGDGKAQQALYQSLAPKMFSVCLRYMGDRESAEDVLQDGFVTLFSKLDSYLGEGSFEGWARRIFVNTALMSLRKTNVLKESDDVEEARDLETPEESTLEKIGYKELMELVEELPPGFRTVFNMYVVEGYSHKEIAESLGISENTSRSQLQRARMEMQRKIRALEEDARRE